MQVHQTTHCLPSTMPVLGENMAARQCRSGSMSRASSTDIHRTSTAPLRCAFSCNARSFSTYSNVIGTRDHSRVKRFLAALCRTVCVTAPCLLLGRCNHELAEPLVRNASSSTVLVQHVTPCLTHPCLRCNHAPCDMSSQAFLACDSRLWMRSAHCSEIQRREHRKSGRCVQPTLRLPGG